MRATFVVRSAWFLLLAGLLVGCASTTIHKDPGKLDKGLRFYRPKPYLLISPLDAAKWGSVGPDEMVEMKLEWLPDFSEEYSVRIRTGIGINKTKVELKDGWNLTKLDADVDAKFKDNLDAITNMVKTVAPSGLIPPPKAGLKATGSQADSDPNRPYRAVVRATNVPLGFYESVIGPGPDGRKQLMGWRYVGFAPFGGIPTTPAGGESGACDPVQMYGLVFESGVMIFKLLASVPAGDPSPVRRTIAMPPTPADTPANPKQKAPTPEQKVKSAVLDILTGTKVGLGGFSEDAVNLRPAKIANAQKVTIEVFVSETTLASSKTPSREDLRKVLEAERKSVAALLDRAEVEFEVLPLPKK